MKSKRIFLSPPHMGGEELEFIRQAFDSNYIAPLGPQVDAFERELAEYVGIPYTLAVSSGTAAMHLAVRLLDVNPGDDVVASTLTFIGSVSPAVYQGAKLTFVDCDRDTWNMNPDLLKEVLEDFKKQGKVPKAVIPTDLYGQCVNYEQIFAISEKYNVPVIADAAEAMGARYQMMESKRKKKGIDNRGLFHSGVGSRAAVFSFNGNKIITTSGGGMLASEDGVFIEHARKLSQQSREVVPYYEHVEIGYNYRMSNVLAAIGRGQLRILNERINKKREIFEYYKEALGNVDGIEFMPEASYGRCNRWLTVILITPEKFGADRESVRLALDVENIEARPIWKPMHLQPVFRIETQNCKPKALNRSKNAYTARVSGGEVAEDLFNRGLCLPSGTALTNNDLDRVINTILNCRKSK
ncbi:MAG: DegT/DnrJ/EryC1/StrS family aminotransferase [Candidatus Omnitrophica bacterium]|nr:DegT/DnrJ/EryC1/StrS family aminotransferase [Candidatus Omnitrophota bacterium]